MFAAERIRRAKCEKRGSNCRTRETDEQTNRDLQPKLLTGKAIADKATKLEREAYKINARLAKASAVKETRVGKPRGALLTLSAVSATNDSSRPSWSYPSPAPAPCEQQPSRDEPQQKLASRKPRLVSDQKPTLSVANCIAERVKAMKGGKLAFRDMSRDYEAIAQRRHETALDAEQFTASLAKLCEDTTVYARESQGTVYVIDVGFAAVKANQKRDAT